MNRGRRINWAFCLGWTGIVLFDLFVLWAIGNLLYHVFK